MYICPSVHLFVPPISSKKEPCRKKIIYNTWGSKSVKIADLFLLKHLAQDVDKKRLEKCPAITHNSSSSMMEGLGGQGLGGRPLIYNSREARSE